MVMDTNILEKLPELKTGVERQVGQITDSKLHFVC